MALSARNSSVGFSVGDTTSYALNETATTNRFLLTSTMEEGSSLAVESTHRYTLNDSVSAESHNYSTTQSLFLNHTTNEDHFLYEPAHANPFLNHTANQSRVLNSTLNDSIYWCRNESAQPQDEDFYEFYETSQFITGLILYPCICFPGLICNVLTLIVLGNRNMRTSTNAFLSALAVADSIKLLNDVLYFFTILLLRTDDMVGNRAYGYLYPYAHFIFSMSVCVSSWLTVSVAVERYIMVELTEMWKNKRFVLAYNWTQNLLRSIIPLIVLVVLNTCIISSLRKTRANKKNSSRHRVTVMMIIVILAFLVCITPDAIMSTVFGLGYTEASNLVKGIREFTDTLLAINAATNFLIYCLFNRMFLDGCKSLFCRTTVTKKWHTELDESQYKRLGSNKTTSCHLRQEHPHDQQRQQEEEEEEEQPEQQQHNNSNYHLSPSEKSSSNNNGSPPGL